MLNIAGINSSRNVSNSKKLTLLSPVSLYVYELKGLTFMWPLDIYIFRCQKLGVAEFCQNTLFNKYLQVEDARCPFQQFPSGPHCSLYGARMKSAGIPTIYIQDDQCVQVISCPWWSGITVQVSQTVRLISVLGPIVVQVIITFMLVRVSGPASVNSMDNVLQVLCPDHQSFPNDHWWRASSDVGHIFIFLYISSTWKKLYPLAGN